MAPFDATVEVKQLADFVRNTAAEYGFGDMKDVFLGGGSDAAFILEAGTPIICSMGVCGQYNHSEREYALVDTLFQRAKLLSTVILRLDEFEKRNN